MDVSRLALASLTSETHLDLPEFEAPPADPFGLAAQWISRAIEMGAREPGTMALATADADGAPSSRFLLLKGFDDEGLLFVSQASSRKGRDIAANPRASASFFWQELRLQLHIAGRVVEMAPEESDALFAARPLASRAVSAVSRQGEELVDEGAMDDQITELISGGAIERPERWVGYRIVPERFEFWQGGDARLHRRLEYTLEAGAWSSRRLQP